MSILNIEHCFKCLFFFYRVYYIYEDIFKNLTLISSAKPEHGPKAYL